MSKRLPPLNSLRAFEVTARWESLAPAAEELAVTPSAVGHQIRTLEKSLGVRLFDRKNKRLTLTATGRHYAEQLSQGFDLLARATNAVRRENADRNITISATPALAIRWLAPALDQLREQGVQGIKIDASSQEANLAAGEIDIDIRYGKSVEPELITDILFSEVVFPVCSQEFAIKHKLKKSEELLTTQLLFVDDWGSRGGIWSAWHDWFHNQNISSQSLTEAGRYSAMDKAVTIAAQGGGVAMGADRHLQMFNEPSNPLVRVCPDVPGIEYAAYLVSLPEVAEERTIRDIRYKLLALAKQSDSVLHDGAF
ncbi:LysR family transcriptional regulator [Aliamphritea hakodatensis]|uniref:LysR family transcriptional regulator n=1 Tax=Aliamphritea hakodatensis TaxID=2895352 RepID=UPI0022FDA48C|nr:LysR family transcriptional regulator [Aliamphritea hakodatensis]